jgi:hypothetical protein
LEDTKATKKREVSGMVDLMGIALTQICILQGGVLDHVPDL